jgi:glycosidase
MNYKFFILYLLPIILIVATSCAAKKSTDSEAATPHVTHPEWATNATIYEVNVRQYSENGTFAEFQQQLPRLKAMGVKILWLMPIHPIGELNRKGTLGSYYSVRDYRAVNPEFGTMDDFKNLVQAIHEQEMYVIIDWVANHCAWDNALLTEHPEWFSKDSLGNMIPPVPDWTDVVDFDYSQQGMRDYMIESMKFWLTECNIDGFRCDVAGMVPIEFWQAARPQLDAIKPVFMLAEDEQPSEHTAFDMTYGWDLMHLMFAIYANERDVSHLDEYFRQQPFRYERDDYRMYFITNHDENSWNGTVQERLGDGAKPFAVLAALAQGMPLVYSGQEAGLNRRLEFFERDPIQWVESDWADFYAKLLNLNLTNPALWNGASGGEFTRLTTNADNHVFAFQQKLNQNVVVAVLNLCSESQAVTIDGLESSGNYRELFTEQSYQISQLRNMNLPPWTYRVYVRY